MHDEDTCCVDGCDEPVFIRRSRKYPHLSGTCKYHYHHFAYRLRLSPVKCRCGVWFTPVRREHRFCSQRCAGSPGCVCASCGVRFWRKGRQTSVCGPCTEARRADEREVRELHRIARLVRPVLVPGRGEKTAGPFVAASCPECLTSFVMTAAHARMGAVDGVRYCSLACGERASRRAYRHRRRARHNGQRIFRARIFERDGWACRLCGDPLDRSADVPHPMAPVIDHIVPLALGGEHAHYNVQAAHFMCNSHKRDLLDGQVALPV